MIDTLLGIKKGMTSTYDARGRRVGATVLEVGPNFVTQVKKASGKDGYEAVQLAFGSKKSVKKPQAGVVKKAGLEISPRWMREVRTEDTRLEAGKEIVVGDIFKKGDAIKVSGTSKGKGFQGGVRRHGFAGGPRTHGQSDRLRAPGSIGQTTTPGRVLKGKRMAGHMGVATVSVRGLEVVAVDKKNNLLTVKGGVPGPVGTLLFIQNIGKIKGYTPPPEEKEDEEEGEAQSTGEQVAENVAETQSTETAQGESNA